MAHGGAVVVPQQQNPFIDVDEWGFWKAGTPDPAGWEHLNNRARITQFVALVLNDLGTGQVFGGALRRIYADGFWYASVTKGFHQKEGMISLVTRKGEQVCHFTVRLTRTPYNPLDAYRTYQTAHIYVNTSGIVCGATLWDTKNNRPVS